MASSQNVRRSKPFLPPQSTPSVTCHLTPEHYCVFAWENIAEYERAFGYHCDRIEDTVRIHGERLQEYEDALFTDAESTGRLSSRP